MFKWISKLNMLLLMNKIREENYIFDDINIIDDVCVLVMLFDVFFC